MENRSNSKNRRKISGNNNSITDNMNLHNNTHFDKIISENAKLMKENIDLHQKFMKFKENTDCKIKELKSVAKKLEQENTSFRYLNSQFEEKIKLLEVESKQKNDRIMELQDKNLQAVIQTSGNKKKSSSSLHQQRMEIDSQIPQSKVTNNNFHPRPHLNFDPYTADLLKIADENINRLRVELSTLRSENLAFQNCVDNLHTQVEMRDEEIARLTKLLEAGNPEHLLIALEAKNRNYESTVAHLNEQIDSLQNEIISLKNTINNCDEVNSNENNNNKYNNNNNNNNNNKNNKPVNNYTEKQEIIQLKRQIEFLEGELEKEKIEIKTKDSKNNKGTKEEIDERRQRDELIMKIQEDKKKLALKVAEMTNNEKELVMEIDRLRHERVNLNLNNTNNNNNNNNNNKRNNKINKNNNGGNDNDNVLCANKACRNVCREMESVVKNVERQKDYWRNEVETLQKVLSTLSKNRSVITNEKLKSTYADKNINIKANKDKNMIAVVEDDGGIDGGRRDGEYVARELEMMTKERDEMRALIEKYDEHINEIQSNVSILSQERDHLNMLYNQAKNELNERRKYDINMLKASSSLPAPPQSSSSSSSSALLMMMTRERDDAMERVNELMRERNQMHERIKELNDVIGSERVDREEQLSRLKGVLHQSEQSESNLREKLMKLEGMMEGRNSNYEERMNKMRDELNQYKATASQMKLIADEAERLSKDKDSSLSLANAELKSIRNRVADLEREVEEWRDGCQRSQEEVIRLKRSLKCLDREKDELQSLIDEKAESTAGKDKLLNDLRRNANESENVISKMKEALLSKDRETSSLKRKLESMADELNNVKRIRDGLMKENKRMQDDITTVTKDNQMLNRDLEDASKARDLSSGQCHEYLNEVRRCQELLSSKEREKNEAIEQYALLTVQSERLESINRSLESEIANQKLRIINGDAELRRLLERCDKMERDLKEATEVEHKYVVQMNHLSNRISNLEEHSVKVENEKRVLRNDLEAVRDLCSKLEGDKSQLQKQVAMKSVTNEEFEALLQDKQHEVEALKVQLNQASQSIDNLENVLQLNRSREWQLQVTLQERQAEVQLLRDRVSLYEAKLANQSRELTQHRSRSIEMESDVERLKRQIISEKFERERAIQELKRNNLPLPGESRLGPISPISNTTISTNNSINSTSVSNNNNNASNHNNSHNNNNSIIHNNSRNNNNNISDKICNNYGNKLSDTLEYNIFSPLVNSLGSSNMSSSSSSSSRFNRTTAISTIFSTSTSIATSTTILSTTATTIPTTVTTTATTTFSLQQMKFLSATSSTTATMMTQTSTTSPVTSTFIITTTTTLSTSTTTTIPSTTTIYSQMTTSRQSSSTSSTSTPISTTPPTSTSTRTTTTTTATTDLINSITPIPLMMPAATESINRNAITSTTTSTTTSAMTTKSTNNIFNSNTTTNNSIITSTKTILATPTTSTTTSAASTATTTTTLPSTATTQQSTQLHQPKQ